MPVANFQPELIELFRTASQREIVLGPFDKTTANRFRFRMHQLRKEMRREQHRDLALAELVTIRLIEDLNNTFQVVCTPESDRDFVSAIRAAGVSLPDPSGTGREHIHEHFLPDSFDPAPEFSGTTTSDMEKLLSEFRADLTPEDKKKGS